MNARPWLVVLALLALAIALRLLLVPPGSGGADDRARTAVDTDPTRGADSADESGLHAGHGGLGATSDDVAVTGGGSEEVTLSTPVAGTLHGRLVGGEPAAYAGLGATAHPSGTRIPIWRIDELDSATVDAEGRFTITDLVPGEYAIALTTPPTRIRSHTSGRVRAKSSTRRAGTARVEGGAMTTAEFDASEWTPCTLRVHVVWNGAPGAGLTVALRSSSSSVGATLDADGRGVMGPVFPGVWEAEVSPASGRWVHRHGAAVTLGAGDDAELRVDITTRTGSILVKDSTTGQPVPNATVYIDGYRSVTADGEGRLEAELVVGDHVFATRPSFTPIDPHSRKVVWGPDGPTDGEVVLVFD